MTHGDINWMTRWYQGAVLRVGLTGSTVWGLARYGFTNAAVGRLINLGAVHYTSPETSTIAGQQICVLWLCDDCIDALAEVEEEAAGAIREGVNTTSEESAKALCHGCQAEKRGLPQLMWLGPKCQELSNEDRNYILAARAEADDYLGMAYGYDGLW